MLFFSFFEIQERSMKYRNCGSILSYIFFHLTVMSRSIVILCVTWCLQLLPEKLPAHLFKKRCFRKVVLLQDPSMNLWPVLYHEGFNFIGFVGGWEDFSIANNLQQGDTCQIEYVNALEPTFKVQVIKCP